MSKKGEVAALLRFSCMEMVEDEVESLYEIDSRRF